MLSIMRGDGDPGWTPLAARRRTRRPAHRPHVAEGDALTTAQVLLALATHLEAHGRGRLRDLTGATWFVRGWKLSRA